MIRSIDEAILTNKKVLVRVDFNVPLNSNLEITDDLRIKESLATIDKIIDEAGIPIIMSHLGRPKGEVNKAFSLKPVSKLLDDKYGYSVIFADDCIGEPVKKAIESARIGDIILLENLRFHKEEELNDSDFAKKIASFADVYVDDAFGTAHRAHASNYAVPSLMNERYAGYLLMNEINALNKALKHPKHPFTAVIGGAKITGKIDVIRNMLKKCNTILIGGGMAFTFLKAMGYEIGKSILEEDKIELAKQLIQEAKQKNVNLILPSDIIVADKFSNDANFKNVKSNQISNNDIGMDIGEETLGNYCKEILDSKTIVWNGPMGVFEMSNFEKGTLAVGMAMAVATTRGAITIVGGGDSCAAIKKLDANDKITHISTGGGASLEFLEGKKLPGITILDY